MQEMKALGKSFGTADNPCQATSDDVSVQDTEEKKYSFPLKREEFMLVTSPFGTRKDPWTQVSPSCIKGLTSRQIMRQSLQQKIKEKLST